MELKKPLLEGQGFTTWQVKSRQNKTQYNDPLIFLSEGDCSETHQLVNI